jgi:branched-chain amino acid transport system substrate-binding protein
MKKPIPLAVIIFLALWIHGCDRKPVIEPSGKTIKIGLIAPLSGPDELKGQEGLRGMQFGMQMQPYLQNGDRIELVTADDRNDPALAVHVLQELAAKENVAAIITFSSSDPVLAMAKVADENKTPILAAIATHPDITRNNAFISQLCFDDRFQGTTAALFVRDELLVDKVAVFVNSNSVYSRDLASQFEKKFESIGGEITDRIVLAEGGAELHPQIKMVQDHSPELLYLPIKAGDVLRVIREAQELHWKPQMMGSDGLLSAIIKQHKKELHLFEGMLAIDFFSHRAGLTPFGKKARDAYKHTPKGKEGAASTTYSTLGVEGYVLLLGALNRCSDPADRECINAKIRSTINFQGIMGNITIRPDGKAERPLYINTIEDGRAEFIVKVY